MSSLQTLKSLSRDAYQNLYDVEIAVPPGLPGFEEIKFRINSFPIPGTPTPSKHTIHYKTQSLEKLGSKFEREHTITIPVRIDRNYLAYEFFKNWKLIGINHTTGVLDEELIPKVPITIRSTDEGDNNTGMIYVFDACYPEQIEGVDFSNESGDPVERNIVIHFDNMDDTKTA